LSLLGPPFFLSPATTLTNKKEKFLDGLLVQD